MRVSRTFRRKLVKFRRMNALWPLLPGWSHEELTRHERRAWSSLPGCSEPPVDPYTEAFLDATLPPPPPQPHRPLPRPADVLQAWRHTTLSGRLSRRRNSCADLLLVSLFDGEIAAVGCGNGSQGLLASKVCYRPRGTQHALCTHPACAPHASCAHTGRGRWRRTTSSSSCCTQRRAVRWRRSHTALAPPSHRPPCCPLNQTRHRPLRHPLRHSCRRPLRSLRACLASRAQRPLSIGPGRPCQRQRLRAAPRRWWWWRWRWRRQRWRRWWRRQWRQWR